MDSASGCSRARLIPLCWQTGDGHKSFVSFLEVPSSANHVLFDEVITGQDETSRVKTCLSG